MKGLRLFVRLAAADDAGAIGELLAAPYAIDPSAVDFVGRLIGDTVAVARTRRNDQTLAIEQIFVAPELRRKRVGTVLLSEIASWAAAHGVTQLVAAADTLPPRLAERAGFVPQNELLIRNVDQMRGR